MRMARSGAARHFLAWRFQPSRYEDSPFFWLLLEANPD
jgi:hypothetical protein